jgi:oligoendopeptidase F
VLGLEKVTHWDRVVSLAASEARSFSWKEARDLVLSSLEPMGREYVDIARKGLTTARWADYAENSGKRSGAYSYGCHDSNPYILMNWTSSLRDVFTLAHELGHSMHSWYARQAQPYHLSGYKIFVAEVASTFHEIMLANHILKTMPNTPIARSIVAERMQGFEGTVLRQTLFATFEREAAALVDQGEALTPDVAETIFGDLTKEWFGPHYHFDPLTAHEWMIVPHFYSTFYVYKYATSQCASESLAEAMLANPEATRQSFLKFLRAGRSKPALDIMLDAGVNFLKPEPIDRAFASYGRMIDAAEKLWAASLGCEVKG